MDNNRGMEKNTERDYGTVPYMASTAWYREYLHVRLENAADDAGAIRRANGKCVDRVREMCRATIAGAHGQMPVLLSVPIAGGASTVKRVMPCRWGLSSHGRWQQMHIGALQAAYGSTPFYSHCMDMLEPVIGRPLTESVGEFARLTLDIHRVVCRILNIEGNIQALREAFQTRKEWMERICQEKSADVMEYMSVFDVIFRKGEEALFALADFKKKD